MFDGGFDSRNGPAHGFAQNAFDFRECLLDGIEIRAVGGKEDQPCSCFGNGVPDGARLVAAEIIHHHNIAWPETWHQDLLDIAEEAFAVDGAVKNTRRCHLINPQGSKEGQSLPVAVRDTRLQPLTAPAPATQGCHVGLYPGLIDEHQPRGLDPRLDFSPPVASAGNVRSRGLFGVEAFF